MDWAAVWLSVRLATMTVLVLCLLAGLGYGAIYALAHWYDPKPREITVSIPPDKFSRQH